MNLKYGHNIGGVWNEETEEYDGAVEDDFKESGAMITGWYEEKHEGYYENGIMYTDGWVAALIDEGHYDETDV